MDTANHQEPVRRVPWIGGRGFFGISWFAPLTILIPAAVGAMLFAERHALDHAGTSSSAYRAAFITMGAILTALASTLAASIAGILTYIVTARRWYTPPTVVFVLVAIAMAAFSWIGFSISNDKMLASRQAQATLDRIHEEQQETARRQLQTDGFVTVDHSQSERAIQGLRDVAETKENPNERAVFLLGAEIGERINELVLAYNTAVEPFVAAGVAQIQNNATEDDLLAMIDLLDQSMAANAEVIAYIERVPAILKIELANRTSLNAPSRTNQAAVFLDEMNHTDMLVVRNAEQSYLAASREQAMVLLDTHGLWENTPEGFLFSDSVDDRYVERFNTAFQAIHQAIADQTAAQGRIFNTTPANPAGAPINPTQP